MPLEPGLLLLFAAVLTALATPALRRWLVAREILDWPEERRSHDQPTPRGGGLAMWFGLLAALSVAAALSDISIYPLLMLSVLALLGWLDDLYEVPVKTRLLVMCAYALGLVLLLGPVPSVDLFGVEWGAALLWTTLGVVAVIWLINLHNFMDGSDGLAALQGCWSAGVLGGLFYLEGSSEFGRVGLAMSGACLGFLFWNRPPARIFMGDAGSLMVGGAIGLLAYAGAATGLISIWVSLMVCSVFVVDATATLLRRGLGQGQWYTPHRSHAYQKLMRLGWSHQRVLLVYGSLNVFAVGPALLIALRTPDWAWLIALLLLALLVGVWAAVQSRCP